MQSMVSSLPGGLIDMILIEEDHHVFNKPMENGMRTAYPLAHSVLKLTQKGSYLVFNALHRALGPPVASALADCGVLRDGAKPFSSSFAYLQRLLQTGAYGTLLVAHIHHLADSASAEEAGEPGCAVSVWAFLVTRNREHGPRRIQPSHQHSKPVTVISVLDETVIENKKRNFP